ncbi:MAG TPA: hypothetical protein VE087_04025, partial [Xanthobacteraceae bacterium]|nr:hypothetical protein [Xanthobacteraceae bacterium]
MWSFDMDSGSGCVLFQPLSKPVLRLRRILAAAALMLGLVAASAASAQTVINVTVGTDPGTSSSGATTPGTLSAALATVNAGGGSGPPYTINVMTNVNLSGPVSPIFNSVTINGNGNTISGTGTTRIFMVGVDSATQSSAAVAGSIIAQRQQVAINDVTLAAGVARGGAGGPGGGGGMGAGGALFVNQSADVRLNGVSFANNGAVGGAGGGNVTSGGNIGGGGGLGGSGGLSANGGGGGGVFGNGGVSGGGGGLFGNGGPSNGNNSGGGGYSGTGGSFGGNGQNGLL